jgi:hypothetical protein
LGEWALSIRVVIEILNTKIRVFKKFEKSLGAQKVEKAGLHRRNLIGNTDR